MKSMGAVLVVAGGLYSCWQFSRAQRRELALIGDLAAALELLCGEIRWKNLPIPEGLRELSDRKISGRYFARVVEKIESEEPLQSAWNSVFCELRKDVSDVLGRLEWSGDTRYIQGSLHFAAQQLRELEREEQGMLWQREKLWAAGALSAAGLLVIILM